MLFYLSSFINDHNWVSYSQQKQQCLFNKNNNNNNKDFCLLPSMILLLPTIKYQIIIVPYQDKSYKKINAININNFLLLPRKVSCMVNWKRIKAYRNVNTCFFFGGHKIFPFHHKKNYTTVDSFVLLFFHRFFPCKKASVVEHHNPNIRCFARFGTICTS